MEGEIQQGSGEQGSLERGLAGDYELSFGGLLSEAWERVAGNKKTVWLAIGIYIGVALLIGLLFGGINGGPADPDSMDPPSLIELLGNLVSIIVVTPMGVGLMFLAVALAGGESPRPKSLFSWYDQTVKLVLTYVLMNVLIVIGLLLLVLPGIYLAVSYQIALPLVADKKMGPWEALEASRKVIGHNWFLVLGLDIVASVVLGGSMLLLGIPLIWTLPACVIGFGIFYRTTVGINEDTLRRTLEG